MVRPDEAAVIGPAVLSVLLRLMQRAAVTRSPAVVALYWMARDPIAWGQAIARIARRVPGWSPIRNSPARSRERLSSNGCVHSWRAIASSWRDRERPHRNCSTPMADAAATKPPGAATGTGSRKGWRWVLIPEISPSCGTAVLTAFCTSRPLPGWPIRARPSEGRAAGCKPRCSAPRPPSADHPKPRRPSSLPRKAVSR